MKYKNGKARNEPALRHLLALLSRGWFVTAAQISVKMGCSRPVAYGRLRALRERGYVFQKRRVREGVSGPESRAYKWAGGSQTRTGRSWR